MPRPRRSTQAGVPGEDLRLTIDASLQLALEQELLAAYIADKAKSVSAVVMDPYTGEIYAQATYPSYDANALPRHRRGRPGALRRPDRVARLRAGLGVQDDDRRRRPWRAGTVTPTTKIKDVGTLKLDNGQSKIDNADRKGMGWITFEDGIAYSRNVVAAKVALGARATRPRESSALPVRRRGARSGFGPADRHRPRRRGRPASCATRRSTPWSEIDLANGAFGQGVAVTPIQLATAYAAMLNGGTLVQPHVVKSVGTTSRTGDRAGHGRRAGRVSDQLVGRWPTTSSTRSRSTATGRRVPGYHVGGKTGTAQIWDAETRALEAQPLQLLVRRIHRARGSGDPDLIVAVRIEEGTPTVARVGQLEMPVMSFELFRRIATNAITTPGPPARRDRRIAGTARADERPVTRGRATLAARDRRRPATDGADAGRRPRPAPPTTSSR